MKKRRSQDLKKGLSPFQSQVIFCLNALYYYGILSVAMVILVIIVVVLTGNIQPVIESSIVDALPIIVGVVVFYPAHLLQEYLLKHWKQLQNR